MLLEPGFLRQLEKLSFVIQQARSSNLVGQQRSRRLGSGLEFRDHRPYQLGDDYRYIDWNLYGRMEQLFVKQFIDERDYLVYMVLDASRSMEFGTPSKRLMSLRLAAALGYVGLAQFDRVGVQFFSDTLTDQLRPLKGRDYAFRLFRFLEQADYGGSTDLNASLRLFAHQHKQPGAAFIFSDFLAEGGYAEGLRTMREQGWAVVLFQVLSQEELDPPLTDAYRLIDAETGEHKEVQVSPAAVDQYRSNLSRLQDEIRTFCRRYQIPFFPISTNTGLESVLFETLFARKGLR